MNRDQLQDMVDKVLDTINRYKLVANGDLVVLALSGGPDSVALFHVLLTLSPRLGISLHALHVNHMLRGAESDGDEAYVSLLCSQSGVPLKICRHDIRLVAEQKGISLEEAGRDIRYRELEDYADSVGASRIALAHNRNDQAETVLMNIIRGTGIKGLTGIDHIRGKIIRPLLDTDRSDIEEYCRLNGLTPRTDSSNLKNDFTRNKIRLDLIPYIKSNFSADITENVCRMSSLARLDNGFIEAAAEEAFEMCRIEDGKGFVKMKAELISKLHPALIKRVLRLASSKALGDLKGIGMGHVEDIEELVRRGRTGACIELPRGLRASMEYGTLKLFIMDDKAAKPVAATFDRAVNLFGNTEFEGSGCVLCAGLLTDIVDVDNYLNMGYNSLVQFFDYDRLKMGIRIHIRHRQDGDIFRPYMSNGSKKLKEYFIDEKIPRDMRDNIPLIACGKEIVWIIGYKISDKFKVTENTRNILRMDWSCRRQNDGGI